MVKVIQRPPMWFIYCRLAGRVVQMESYRNRIFAQSVSEAWPLPEESIDMIVTSPPYWNQRDNGSESVVKWFDGSIGQLGQEKNPQDYINNLVNIFDGEGRRCLKPGGQLWVNLGDTFSKGISGLSWGEKSQRLLIPHRFAIAMQERGWVLRNELIWAKGVMFSDNTSKGGGMPSAVHDRLNHQHEPFFGFVKPDELRKPFYVDPVNNRVSWLDLTRITSMKKPQLELIAQQRGLDSTGKKSELIQRINESKVHLEKTRMKMRNYFSDLNSIRIPATWVDEDGQRTDFFGRKMGSVENAGASVKQNSISQPHKYITNHPLGKNPGSVWQINTNQGSLTGDNLSHSAPYPTALIEKLITFSSPVKTCKSCALPTIVELERESGDLVECNCDCDEQIREPGLVLDPFMGAGSTAIACLKTERDYVGIEVVLQYIDEANQRIENLQK